MPTCPACGKELPGEFPFCPFCGAALAAAGLATLDDQARALGLSRSTTWAVLKGNHKASGLSTATISRMLFSPELPPHVRATLLMYVEERAAGLFGHNEQQLRRFALSFCSSIREVFSRAPCTSSELFALGDGNAQQ